jgi:hypothetical protein
VSLFLSVRACVCVCVCTVSVKWGQKKLEDVPLDPTEPPLMFKTQLFSLTGVPPERQTIMTKAGTLKVRTHTLTHIHIRHRADSVRALDLPGRQRLGQAGRQGRTHGALGGGNPGAGG